MALGCDHRRPPRRAGKSLWSKKGESGIIGATVPLTISNILTRFGPRPCFGYEPSGAGGGWLWATYAEVHASAKAVRTALQSCGVRPGAFVGICGVNCLEWVTAMLGVLLACSNGRRPRPRALPAPFWLCAQKSSRWFDVVYRPHVPAPCHRVRTA